MNFLSATLDGFDGQRLKATLRTACAAVFALAVANALGVDSPGWAAMTVILVSQPTRGLLQARSFYRVLGTVVGAAVGALFVLLAGRSPALLVLMLAVWLGLCSWVGNVARQLGSYGVLLSGYTAAIVSLLSLQHHDDVAHLASDRIEGVLIGAVIAVAVNGLFTPRSATAALLGSVPRLVGDTLSWAARMAQQGATPELLEQERRLVRSMADIESGLDEVAFGSRRKQQRMAHIRGVFAALLTLGASIRTVAAHLDKVVADPALRGWRDEVVRGLDDVHAALEAGKAGESSVAPLRRLVESAPANSRIRGALENLVEALAAVIADRDGALPKPPPAFALRFHRDWVGARVAALRTVLSVSAVGAVWVLTGWEYGAFMVMGTAVFMPLFSIMEQPSAIMRNVAFGSCAGIAAAVLFSWLVVPYVDTEAGLLLAITPVLAVGALALAHRSTMLYAMDYCLVFLLMLHPSWPLHTTVADTLGGGQGMVLGLAAAWLSFSYLVPVNAAQRLRVLATHIVRDIECLAQSRATLPAWKWRARMHHRILRLVARAAVAGSNIDVGDGMAALGVGDAVLHMLEMLRRGGLPADARRAVDEAVASLALVSSQTGRAADALARASQQLRESAAGGPRWAGLRADAEILRDAADALAAHKEFFAAAGGQERSWLRWAVAG